VSLLGVLRRLLGGLPRSVPGTAQAAGSCLGSQDRPGEIHGSSLEGSGPGAPISAYAGRRRALLSASDRESPRFTVGSGTQRACCPACPLAAFYLVSLALKAVVFRAVAGVFLARLAVRGSGEGISAGSGPASALVAWMSCSARRLFSVRAASFPQVEPPSKWLAVLGQPVPPPGSRLVTFSQTRGDALLARRYAPCD
jgi:hypothetical protein